MELTWYEKNQGHNFVTKWLHSFRYKRAIDFVAGFNRPMKIVDIGCGYGKLFDVLNPLFPIEYTGIEIDETFANIAKDRHAGIPNFSVINANALTALSTCKPDAVMALETFEHVPERDVVRLIEQIAALRVPLFATVPVEIGPALWLKNVGSAVCGYVRHKDYSWHDTFWAGLYQLDRLPPHGTLHNGFDWRWLAATIRQNMRIKKTHHFPLGFLPAAVSSSVCFVAVPH